MVVVGREGNPGRHDRAECVQVHPPAGRKAVLQLLVQMSSHAYSKCPEAGGPGKDQPHR